MTDPRESAGSQNCTPAVSNGVTRRLLGAEHNSAATLEWVNLGESWFFPNHGQP
jgi:hypothetical protein